MIHLPITGIVNSESSLPILDGLEAWYKMNETSGTRINSHTTSSPNLYNLLEDTSVGYTTGVLSNAAVFTGPTSPRGGILVATHATSPLPSLMSATTISGCCWVKPASYPSSLYHVIRRGKIAPTAIGDVEWGIVLAMTGSPQVYRARVGFQAAGLLNQIIDAVDTVIAPATWYFIYWYRDAVTGLGGISVNDGTIYTTPFDADPIGNDHGTIMAGSYNNTSSSHDHLRYDGALDEVGLWQGRTLSAADVTNLYNAGAGVTYEDLTW